MTIDDLINEIKELKDLLKESEQPVSEEEACNFLTIERATMRNYVSRGKMEGTYTFNVLGKRMFYKSKLVKPVAIK